MNRAAFNSLPCYGNDLCLPDPTARYGQVDITGVEKSVGDEVRDGRKGGSVAVTDVARLVGEVVGADLTFLGHKQSAAFAA